MRYRLSIFLILVSLTAFCQTKQEIIPAKLKEDIITIQAKDNIAAGYNFPFSSVKVIDYRFDTSKIGFGRSRNAYNEKRSLFAAYPFKKIILKKGLQQSVENFYNDYYKNCFSNDSIQLLIVIKRFWADPFPNSQVKRQKIFIVQESTFDLYVGFEFFMNKNKLYLPLKRIDTVFQISANTSNIEYLDFKEKKYSIYEYVLTKVFESLNYQMYADHFETSKNKKTLAELIAFSERRFNYPILKDSILKKGIYMNFSEFRNNQPSIENYKLEIKKKIGKLLYNGNDSSQVLKYWGYCDGEKIYNGDLEYPLSRVENTFDFFANRFDYFKDSFPLIIGSSVDDSPSFIKVVEPFQIDMETGKIY